MLRHLAALALKHPDVWCDPDRDPVAHYLECSIAADPEHLPATLDLLEGYRTDDDPKEWHRAAEEAVQRFPGDVAVLLHAVNAAVARNAYKRAVGFARQVLTVDPINVAVRERMIELQLAHARKQMRSGRADLAGKALGEAAEWERPEASSAALRIGRTLVAMTTAQGSGTRDTLRAVVQDAGNAILGWFHVALEASMMGWPDKRLQPFQPELEAAHTVNRTAQRSWRWSVCSVRRKSATAARRSPRICVASTPGKGQPHCPDAGGIPGPCRIAGPSASIPRPASLRQ